MPDRLRRLARPILIMLLALAPLSAAAETFEKTKDGPTNVTDVQYLFYAPGVGKVAEFEALSVSALLIYHSHDKTAKMLTKHPEPAT